jgi:metacaspase-1
LDAAKSYSQGDLSTALVDGTSIVKILTRSKETREKIRQTRTSPADVIQMSGSKNYETSADAFEGVRYCYLRNNI